MTRDLRPDPVAFPPRGLSRDQAARYIGVGTTKFDELVADGRMPPAKKIDGRKVWDRFGLDAAFTDLPDMEGGEAASGEPDEWDDVAA